MNRSRRTGSWRRLWAVALATVPAVVACGDDTGPPDARGIDAAPAPGSLSLTWSIEDRGTALTCAQVGAASVTLSIVPDDQPFGSTDVLTCAPGAGTSRQITPGVYDVTATLSGVATEGVRFDDVVVAPGADTALGAAAFEVLAEGGFTFNISAGGQGNCTSPAQGGAGITTMQIELSDAGGTCVPVTFDIAAGATQAASTYTTSCAPAAAVPCIAQDQTISVAPTLPTGSYRMTITGFIDADACWTRQPQFQVPAGGVVQSLPQQNLTLNAAIAACNP